METSPISPSTQPHPSFTATSTKEDEVETNTSDIMKFSNSTKKIDKATEKIYAHNARKQDETEKINDNIVPQIVYLDPSNSANQTVELTNSTLDTIPQATNDTNNEKSIDENIQLHTESLANTPPAPAEANPITENKAKGKDNSEELQMEKVYSPASSLVCKTPPSSPQPDSISDLNEEDLQALNEIP